jgi:hypothetical protein
MLELSPDNIKISSIVKFHENLSSQSRVVPSGWADMARPTIAFCNFTRMPKKYFPLSEEIKVVTIHAISQELSRFHSVNIVTLCGCEIK